MTLPQTNVFPFGTYGEVTIDRLPDSLEITHSFSPSLALYVALDHHDGMGSPIVPFGQSWEGSTVFLPFGTRSIFYVVDDRVYFRTRRDYAWSDREPAPQVGYFPGSPSRLSIPLSDTDRLNAVIYIKDLTANDG